VQPEQIRSGWDAIDREAIVLAEATNPLLRDPYRPAAALAEAVEIVEGDDRSPIP